MPVVLSISVEIPEGETDVAYSASLTLGNPESFSTEATHRCQGGNNDGGGLCAES